MSGEAVGGSGRYVRAGVPGPGEKTFDIAVDATLRAAAMRRAAALRSGAAQRGGEGFRVEQGDLRKKIRVARGNRLVLFLVDASDSMDSFAGLAAAKGAVLALLSAAYIRRDRVGLIAFRDEKAVVLLPPTSSVQLAEKKLRLLSAGGATPFADGLLAAWKTIRTDRLKHPAVRTVMVILSDGEANVPLSPGGDKTEEIKALGGMIRAEKIRVVFVDTSPPGGQRPEARDYADFLDAEYRRVSRLRPRELVDIVGMEGEMQGHGETRKNERRPAP